MKQRIILITSGRGPAECCWVVAQVLKRFLDAAAAKRLAAAVLQKNDGDQNRTIQSVMIQMEPHEKLDDFLKQWVGIVQWIGQSTFRKHHKRKNWFIAISEMKNHDFDLDSTAVKIDTMRSSGKGGQHVNKVSSAVRATHLTTGLSAMASDQRSQQQNKKIALLRLSMKLEEWKTKQMGQQDLENWESKIQIERGNPIQVFRGTDFKQVKKKKDYRSSRQRLSQELRNELKNLN